MTNNDNPVLELRTDLTTILTGLIGQYVKTGVPNTPAIWVVPPIPVMNRKVINGLELIISRTPEIEPYFMLNSRGYFKEYWLVQLICHDPNQTTYTAVKKILKNYTDSHVTTMPRGDLTLEVANIRICRNEIFHVPNP